MSEISDVSEQRALLAETVDKLFGDMMEAGVSQQDYDRIAQGVLPGNLWQAVEENGIPAVCVPEALGGFGGGWEDAFIVLSRAGYYGLPLPIAETVLAQRLLAQADIAIPAGPIALAVTEDVHAEKNGNGVWQLNGKASAVAWANAVDHVLVECRGAGPRLALVERAALRVGSTGQSVAKEPFADLHFDKVAALACGPVAERPFLSGALMRTAQMAGALDAALRLSVQYANERVQFGKPIGKFQAIQQSLAVFADEVAAVNCAVLTACRAAERGDAEFEIAAAKLRANRASGIATSTAHQVHGAIGFTREHRLHIATQHLWSWRSEFGNDRYWANVLGGMVAARGAHGFWAELTARSDAG